MPLVLVDLLSYTGTKGGMETYARELYREIGAAPGDFTFVGLGSREIMSMDQDWFPGDVVDSGISGENRFSWAYGELYGVSRWADKLGVDLIHCPALLGPIKSRMPTVLTLHDMLYFSHPQYMTTGFYTKPVRWMEKKAAENAARVLTISEQSRSDIQTYLHVPADRIDMVPLAGKPTHRPTRSAQPQTGPLILATGNRRPHKNWEGLVRALALVDPAIRPDLVVTGSHGDDPLAPVVTELGLEKWVDLKGWVSSEELADLYERTTVMAMPSFCDGFCLPALEAMVDGIPVMLSDIPVYREVGGEAALYFEPTDLGSIADAITTAASDPALLASLVEKGYAQAAKFSWKRTAEGTIDSFNAALGRTGAR
jgi:glycosyltransferase involved in cell wall biosynthesis